MVIDSERASDVSVGTTTMYFMCDGSPDDRKSEPGGRRLEAMPLRSSGGVGGPGPDGRTGRYPSGPDSV